MFNVGGGEIIVIMLLALIVLGPQRLPDAARQIGKTMGELRRLSNGFQNEIRGALDSTDDDLNQVTARRNVLAKEAPVNGSTPVDDTTDRPVRTEPLVAGPGLEPRNSATPSTSRPPSAQARAAAKKQAAAKTPAAKTPATKKAATKNGTAVKKASPKATATKAANKPTKAAAPSPPSTKT